MFNLIRLYTRNRILRLKVQNAALEELDAAIQQGADHLYQSLSTVIQETK